MTGASCVPRERPGDSSGTPGSRNPLWSDYQRACCRLKGLVRYEESKAEVCAVADGDGA